MFAGVSAVAERLKERLCSPSSASMRKFGYFEVDLLTESEFKVTLSCKKKKISNIVLIEALVAFPNLEFHIRKGGQRSANTVHGREITQTLTTQQQQKEKLMVRAEWLQCFSMFTCLRPSPVQQMTQETEPAKSSKTDFATVVLRTSFPKTHFFRALSF